MNALSILSNQDVAFVTVRPNDSLETAVALMNRYDAGSILVLSDAGVLQGIIVERDILKAIDRAKSTGLQLKVKDVASREVPTCCLNDTEDTLMERMVRCNTQYLPVVDGATVFGVVSMNEVVKMRLQKMAPLRRDVPETIYFEPRVDHFSRHLKPRQQHT